MSRLHLKFLHNCLDTAFVAKFRGLRLLLKEWISLRRYLPLCKHLKATDSLELAILLLFAPVFGKVLRSVGEKIDELRAPVEVRTQSHESWLDRHKHFNSCLPQRCSHASHRVQLPKNLSLLRDAPHEDGREKLFDDIFLSLKLFTLSDLRLSYFLNLCQLGNEHILNS